MLCWTFTQVLESKISQRIDFLIKDPCFYQEFCLSIDVKTLAFCLGYVLDLKLSVLATARFEQGIQEDVGGTC